MQVDQEQVVMHVANHNVDSEGAFFNYTNHVDAERRYLLEDAYPDWKHKSSRAGLNEYNNIKLTFKGRQMTLSEWFSQLQTAVSYWCDEAQDTELPEFETTIMEYESHSSTPTTEDADTEFETTMDQQPTSAAHKPVDAHGLMQHMSKALEAY
jgi:hypothetical protein